MGWIDPDNWHWREGPVEPGPTVVFDMDGVLSDATKRQHYLEWPRRDWETFFAECGEDELIAEVGRLLDCLDADLRIVLLTARPIRVQPQTLGWLKRYELRWDLLIMRDWGDYMAAPSFKQLTVRELRAYGFDLRLAFEDDQRNVDMFHGQGVPCVYIHSGYHGNMAHSGSRPSGRVDRRFACRRVAGAPVAGLRRRSTDPAPWPKSPS